ncbi:MAG: histone deacetylase [Solirubrobacteraceae bacterium]|nr:histone deacetylase [Solirubrobacteraceae bacterium]MCU0313404.1 histone deacetylase [Solirubrobacteraceae bacterium]
MRPVLLRHDSSARHDTGAHPERIARIRAIEAALAERDWLGWDVAESPAASDALLHAVHPPAYCAAIEQACRAGGGALDADTIVSAGSHEAARHAAGGAAALVDALLAGAPVGASLHRPPGHHAEASRAMGFCLFNNVAVAARHALDAHGLERVLILDWDVHHGNGTNDLFHADPRVLFCSIHEWPLYPGSGSSADHGSGAGLGATVNLPVPGGSGDAVFTAMVDHVVVPAARAHAPQLILVSAGFDAHADDPLAGCEVSDAGFAAMAASMRRLAAELEAPLGVVLEGGYDLGALARGVVTTLETVARDPGTLPAAPAARHPLADEAAQRVAARRPG